MGFRGKGRRGDVAQRRGVGAVQRRAESNLRTIQGSGVWRSAFGPDLNEQKRFIIWFARPRADTAVSNV